MAKYQVRVRVTKILKEPLKIFASDPVSAEEKAAEIVSKWDDIEDAEGFDAQEIG
jgi:hypothetical protein